MNTLFAAVVEGDAAVVMWVVIGIVCLWVFYMMTFRTEDWLRLRKEEEERKAKRHERAGNAFKGALFVARWWLKK
jgi:hypothetical protein